jgi:plastocyanin
MIETRNSMSTRTWRSLGPVLIVLSLLIVLFPACAIRDTSTIATGPAVKMLGGSFGQDSITIKKGESLTFENVTSSAHVIANGTWENGIEKPGVESGAPAVNLNSIGNDSVKTPPFNTVGTYKLYCPVHGGMNLTVVVQ